MPHQTLPASWLLARLPLGPTEDMGGLEWIPATVPGAVQLDWARARGLPDLRHGQNVKAYAGLEDHAWLYRTTRPEAPLASDERLFICGDGVDHEATLSVDGEERARLTGIGCPWELDLSATRPGAVIDILVHPAPKQKHCEPGRLEAARTTKAPVSYGWDWHPRLIPLGLQCPVRFEKRPRVHLRHLGFSYRLSENLDQVDIHIKPELSEPASFSWTLQEPGGRVVLESRSTTASLPRPRLWWTHTHGEPFLYELTLWIEGQAAPAERRKVGFRRVRLVMREEAWLEPSGFPKSRSLPPTTLELNGKRLFALGANWVPPDIFHCRESREVYATLLGLAREAHFNLLRCWGGGAAPQDCFHALCDELGILVWQEFPLACNAYPDDPSYLAELDRVSKELIRRVSRHPSLALWCGGNELFNAWSRMDDQSLALRLLNRNCLDLDPLTPFLPTSPLEGMGHGDYRFLDEGGREVFRIFQEASGTAYPEFGVPGPSPARLLREIIPAEELWPPREGTSWETHHGLQAWVMEPTSWLCTATQERLFGGCPDLETMVAQGTWLQCEGYKAIYEEARRQAPRCSMALAWCFNEPWPTAANNSLVNHPAAPKPAFHAVKEACRPVLASARIPRFRWAPGERFHAELWMLNDSDEVVDPGRVLASLLLAGAPHQLLEWSPGPVPAHSRLQGPSASFHIPESAEKEFVMKVELPLRPELSSSYRLLLHHGVTGSSRTVGALNA